MFIIKTPNLFGYHSKKQKLSGFTLLEILIALFIFTILSTILAGALRSVINADAGTEKNAERLRNVQLALLMMSRDIEQIVDRPVLNAVGKEEPAFIGSAQGFTFTHAGFANPEGILVRSSLQRTRYEWQQQALGRLTWPMLDLAPKSPAPHSRQLLSGVLEARFEYMDKEQRFHRDWPLLEGQQPLPRAIRVVLTISQWGKISQLYVIPAQPTKTLPAPPPPKS